MAEQTLSNLHIMGVDGTNEQVINGMYKEMTVDRFKRAVTVLYRRPVNSWEDLQLFYLGNEMYNDQTIGACGLQDGAIIRYIITDHINEKRLPLVAPVETIPPPPAYNADTLSSRELTTVFATDVDHNRSLNVGPVTLGMPIREFIDKIAARQGVDPDHLRVIYRGKQLEEGKTLMDYNLQDEGTVHCVIRVLGGAGF